MRHVGYRFICFFEFSISAAGYIWFLFVSFKVYCRAMQPHFIFSYACPIKELVLSHLIDIRVYVKIELMAYFVQKHVTRMSLFKDFTKEILVL